VLCRVFEADFEAERADMLARFAREKRVLATVLEAIEKEEEERDNEVRRVS
jgi:hypothetical protein